MEEHLQQTYVHEDTTNEERVIIRISQVGISMLVAISQLNADLALTHSEASLLPSLKLQWPIAPRDDAP